MPFEGYEGVAGLGVPEAEGLVVACGEDADAVGGEGAGSDGLLMPFEGYDGVAGLGIPEAQALVVAC